MTIAFYLQGTGTLNGRASFAPPPGNPAGITTQLEDDRYLPVVDTNSAESTLSGRYLAGSGATVNVFRLL